MHARATVPGKISFDRFWQIMEVALAAILLVGSALFIRAQVAFKLRRSGFRYEERPYHANVAHRSSIPSGRRRREGRPRRRRPLTLPSGCPHRSHDMLCAAATPRVTVCSSIFLDGRW